jgi:4-oxalocrotonate tautomerase
LSFLTQHNIVKKFIMPTINVQLFEGRTPDQKRAFAKTVTEATCLTLGVPAESVVIIIQEVKAENWATGGKLWSDKNKIIPLQKQ